MKIGIVTFNSAFSYGAVLQAYALQAYLKKIGHEPFFVNYKNLDSPFVQRPSRLLSLLKWKLIRVMNNQLLHYFFIDFQRNYLNANSYQYIDYQQLRNNPPAADAFVCGSDQIWHPYFCFSKEEGVVWLNFGDEQIRRLSYAASFGDLDLDEEVCQHWTKYAQRLDSLSVREKDAVELVKKLNRSGAVWVPDPTLLLNACDYDPIEICSKNRDVPSIFSYLLVTHGELFTKAHKTLCEEIGGPLHDCRPTNFRHNMTQGGLIKPGQWISKLRNAKFVLSDSYHGVLFSLIFHRPFIVLRSRRSRRIASILQIVGLEDRMMENADSSRIKTLCHQEVDWARVDARIQQFREVGFRFLLDALL